MERSKLLAVGFALLGAFAGAFLGARLFSGGLLVFACLVVGAVVGWFGGSAAAVRQRSGDS